MADGSFRQKSGFTIVQNSIARDKNISMKAKGLYLIIQSYITMPNRVWLKSDFMEKVQEGQKPFDSAWNELKENGYLKVHITMNGNKFEREYELLDVAAPGAHTFYYNSAGEVTKTVPKTSSENDKKDENLRLTPNGQVVESTENTEDLRHTKIGQVVTGSVVTGGVVTGQVVNGDVAIDNPKDDIYINNNTRDNNTLIDNPLLLQTENVTFEAESVKPDMSEEEEEEKIKKQINYERLIRKHCDSENKKLLTFIVRQMTEMVHESGSMVKISTNHLEPKTKVIEHLRSITYDDIENLLYMLPDKKENYIKNPIGYMRNCLFNIVDRRGAICYTNQIKHKGNNQGLIHQEYDFDELEKTLFGG